MVPNMSGLPPATASAADGAFICQIRAIGKRIDALMEQHPGARVFRSFPGETRDRIDVARRNGRGQCKIPLLRRFAG